MNVKTAIQLLIFFLIVIFLYFFIKNTFFKKQKDIVNLNKDRVVEEIKAEKDKDNIIENLENLILKNFIQVEV